jgi:hypothetical protein
VAVAVAVAEALLMFSFTQPTLLGRTQVHRQPSAFLCVLSVVVAVVDQGVKVLLV